MRCRTTDMSLSELDKERDHLISILRSPGEMPHAVIKRIFCAGIVLVTNIRRVHIKMVATAFTFNLFQLCTLKKAKVI
jgi:transposase, IS5 family